MPNLVFASLTAKENPMNTPALPRYSFGEELANSLTHGLGIVLAIAGLAVMAAFATLYGGVKEVVSCISNSHFDFLMGSEAGFRSRNFQTWSYPSQMEPDCLGQTGGGPLC